MKTLYGFLIATLLAPTASFAGGKIQAASPQERLDYIKQADIWIQPSWISNDFTFSTSLDVLAGPAIKGDEIYLLKDKVFCKLQTSDLSDFGDGATPKFHCELTRTDASGNPSVQAQTAAGAPFEIKVRYDKNNGEVWGGVLGTRLMWALGFGADRFFAVNEVDCYGCTMDPFKNRQIDPQSQSTPRPFSPASVQLKSGSSEIVYIPPGGDATQIVSGWSWQELTLNLDDSNPSHRARQLAERDALRLLIIFVQDVDLKEDNQRLVCLGAKDATGKCTGQVQLMIGDIGTSFGGGTHDFPHYLSKVQFQPWSSKRIWQDPSNCVANLGGNSSHDPAMNSPQISEAGRQLLLKLLTGFSGGPDGRKRVEDLFSAAHIETRGDGTVQQWADAFMSKVAQIQNPTGQADPSFRCPPLAVQ